MSAILGLLALGALTAGTAASAQEPKWKKLLSCENDRLVVDVDETRKDRFQVVVRNDDAITYLGRYADSRGQLIIQGLSAFQDAGRSFFEAYGFYPKGDALEGVDSLLAGPGAETVLIYGSSVGISFPGHDRATLNISGFSNGEMAGPDRFWHFYGCQRF